MKSYDRIKRKMIAFIAIMLSITCMATACGRETKSNETDSNATDSAEISAKDVGEPSDNSEIANDAMKTVDNINFVSTGFAPMNTPYTPIDIVPAVRDYQVSSDLSNIVNLSQFSYLTAEQRQKIAQNGFVVIPSDKEQMFYIYEYNEYEETPGLVTADSVLHLYHIFFDYTLRTSETEKFFPAMRELNRILLDQLMAAYNEAEAAKESLAQCIAYFGVAALLMEDSLPTEIPADIMDLINAEYALIQSESEAFSPLVGVKLDYSQFTTRGHYTRSETLTRYFKTMMWYGLVPFRFYDETGNRDEKAVINALVMVKALFDADQGSDLWESVYSPTCFFVGSADDITPQQIKAIMDVVYGEGVDFDELVDASKLDLFYEGADRLPKPRINAKRSDTSDTAIGLQYRFMGQRYIPDSEILQELTEPLIRPVPTGLDVFSVMGSDRAYELNEQYHSPAQVWPEYTEKHNKLSESMAQLKESDWQSNLYYGWLWVLQSLTGRFGSGYPLFMQNEAWQDKSLATGLGSWAELRHDTILYGKQSGAEKGGGAAEIPPSYVEPNAELYTRLLWLVRYSKENLQARNMLDEKVLNKMENFESMLDFMLQCAIKELQGEDLNEEENIRIMGYGGWLEHLSTSFVDGDIYHWFEIESETDRNMALIADVHTVLANEYYPYGSYLEEAVGHAAEIYAAIPVGDKVYLARGAVFDYFEFLSDKRMTDEEWQQMLKSGSAPERPAWVRSFMGNQ